MTGRTSRFKLAVHTPRGEILQWTAARTEEVAWRRFMPRLKPAQRTLHKTVALQAGYRVRAVA